MIRGVAAGLSAAFVVELGSLIAAAGATASCMDTEECPRRPDGEGDLGSLLQSHTPRSQPSKQSLSSKEASGALTEIQKDYIVVNGRGFSRYGAQTALLGSYGSEQHLTAWIPPHLSFTKQPEDAWLADNTIFGPAVWIETSQESRFDVDLSITAIPAVEIVAGLDLNSSDSRKFYLKNIRLASMFKLVQALNTPEFEANRTYMQEQMDRPRIVTAVWILIEGDEAHSSFCSGGSLALKVLKKDVMSVSGHDCDMKTWSFSPDSVMAYESAKIKFDKDGTVASLEIDQATVEKSRGMSAQTCAAFHMHPE
eukprot:CAMPEP_0115613810 /NCGR_PEP_ID=MMETSP0272-20121206/21781_1 /TAXON_ID=71861 /ORGANISM="Scrippsiella trochoidea, Strain CCMP3099" /LENGTH=309 /DNA_ID=CAMNT_0003049667 /DNA_START=68 /DNA_END=995 /DNA_ORIENTATION=+